MSALNMVRRRFANVKRVVDATKSVFITVSREDNKQAKPKDMANCALARACKRQNIADGAIIGLTTSYLIKGDTATRYITSNAVGREIVSFDRHHNFAEGVNYRLSKISPSTRLGTMPKGRKSSGKLGPRKQVIHRTDSVRKYKEFGKA